MATTMDEVARAVPAYDVEREIGRGGVGAVYLATHRRLGRRVAIKQLAHGMVADERVRRRFVTEARVLAELDHPHIVRIHDFVEHTDICLLIMELVDGPTLAARRVDGSLSVADACAATVAATSALAYAHARGVLHRDVKPQNMLIGTNGVLKVVDFGIAKVIGGDASLATMPGDILGTPAYMAPEQVNGSPPAPATDVYALGTMLYELLSGRLPFDYYGEPLQMLLARVESQPIELTSVAPVARDLSTVVMRSIQPAIADRFASADQFGAALARAATTAFGPDWVGRSSLTVRASGDIGAALEDHRVGAGEPRRVPDAPLPDPTSTARLATHPPISTEELTSVLPIPELIRQVTADVRHAAPPPPAVSNVAQPAPAAELDVHEPGRPARRIRVQRTTEVGRQCQGYNVADAEMSRRHLRLVLDADRLSVEDLGSTNGTFVNDERISATVEVHVGDIIAAGDTRFRVIGTTP
jgi:serine/threonine-protein kinase